MGKPGRRKASELPDGPFCGAKCKRTGKPCTNQPMENGRCRLHGGKSRPGGPTHQSFKSGKFSRYLPPAIAKRVDEAANDPTLLSIRGSIELFQARLTEILERLATGESGELWAKLQEAQANFVSAQREIQRLGEEMKRLGAELSSLPPDDPRVKQIDRETERIQAKLATEKQTASNAMLTTSKLIEKGATAENMWREALDLLHEKAQLQSAEIKNQATMRMVLTAEDALYLIHQVQLAIVEEVKDQETRVRIGRRLVPLLGRTTPAGAGAPVGEEDAVALPAPADDGPAADSAGPPGA